jgi:hypothetical protein
MLVPSIAAQRCSDIADADFHHDDDLEEADPWHRRLGKSIFATA